MSERRSRSTSRPDNYKDFNRTGAMASGRTPSGEGENEQGESENFTLEAPNWDSDIDGPDPVKSKKTKKTEAPTKEKIKTRNTRSKNPSMNLIPSGTVSSNIRSLESELLDESMHLQEVHEGQTGHDVEKTGVHVAHSAAGTHVLKVADNTEKSAFKASTIADKGPGTMPLFANAEGGNKTIGAAMPVELRTDKSHAIELRTEKSLNLPQPTWVPRPP